MNAKEALTGILGTGDLVDDPEILEKYSRDISFVNPVRPQFVARPGNVEEVQTIVKWANETRTPLVPVSSGSPHFRGDTIPSIGGIVVDLSAMDKVIRIDKRNRIVMIEPGVKFDELQAKINQEGLRLNMPLLPRKSKSVIGSLLEREPVMMPGVHWDAIDPLSCTEIVFGTGDLFRTGTASGPGTLEEQWEMGAAQTNMQGPGQVDFCRLIQGAQGTMGIVTWASLRCEILPAIQKPFLVGSRSFEKLAEAAYRLLWLKSVDECLVLNSTDMAAIVAREWPGEYKIIRDALPAWLLFLCLGGCEEFLPEEKIACQEELLTDAARQSGVEPVGGIAGVSAYELSKMLTRCSDQPYWKLRYKGACQDIFFVTTLDKVPGFVEIMHTIANEYNYPTADMGIYVQPMVQGTNCHCEFTLFYDPDDEKEVANSRALFTRASEALMNAGAFFNRPYGQWADMVYRRDAETANALKKVKGIFDSNNVMNPGKLCF